MRPAHRIRIRALAAAGAAALLAPLARAQAARNVTLVVPYTPGSGPDAVARTLAPRLATRLGSAVVVENKAGASGNIGADFVAKAKPDGATLMVTVNTFNVTPALYKKLPYDPIADFTPIARLGVSNLALVVNASVPVQNLEQLVALAKSRPGSLSYSSPGAGTTPHLAMEVFKKRYGLDILHVPYRGSAGATTDLVGGQTQLMMIPVHTGLPFVKQGKLRMLAVLRDTRSPFAPEVPSLGEFGASNLDLEVVFWLSAPAGLPPADVARLNREVTALLAMPEVREAFAVQGITPEPGTPQQLADYIRTDVERWKRFVAEQNITLE
jgi:tripartite-type tricarboxylate transporter receptor subunit TctC